MPTNASTPSAADFEKLGSFYLGKAYDLDARRRTDDLILYDSRDLVTHAVCVGMTGSGKTGLCIGLIEEAAIDGVPAIVIDPKGDLSNLLLTFPELKPDDFLPWINADDAQRKGLDTAAFAAQQAALWTKGLAEWGEDGARIARLKRAADFTIYTPGSSAGVGVCVLKGFDPPPPQVLEDAELLRERIASTATGLLALAGVSSEPNTGREHILVSTILGDAWANGRSLDLPALIAAVQSPSVKRVGVMDLETFYPAKDRFGLALALNNLVAAPGFSRWLDGEPLDIASMLRTPEGKPRIAIFSIAHLSDPERMFFVSLLLNQTLGWVRTQSGTSSLRALLYMDEIAGYVPPVANPPSKGPLLTLMKQGRAFGLGVVLATQNPVDLDYKGLSNAGTWFIGRLQTERDKARVLDGLEGAAANAQGGFDRGNVDKLLSRLGTRVFLMNNVHENGPVVFETRWCMSYLRGPMTREQIRAISDGGLRTADSHARQSETGAIVGTPSAGLSPPSAIHHPKSDTPRPVLPPGVPEYFISPPANTHGPFTYSPVILGFARVAFSDSKSGVDTHVPASLMVRVGDGPVAVDWEKAEPTELTEEELQKEPAAGESAAFEPLPSEAARPASYEEWQKSFADALVQTQMLTLLRSAAFDLTSLPGESERDFRARLAQTAREERDAVADKLRAKYTPKIASLQDRLRRAEQAVAVQKQQSTSAKLGTALSFGSAILGAFLGRKTFSAGNISRAATAARGVGRSAKESGDVGRAEENADSLRDRLAEMQTEFQSELDAAGSASDAAAENLEKVELKPKKSGITVRAVVLAWEPK